SPEAGPDRALDPVPPDPRPLATAPGAGCRAGPERVDVGEDGSLPRHRLDGETRATTGRAEGDASALAEPYRHGRDRPPLLSQGGRWAGTPERHPALPARGVGRGHAGPGSGWPVSERAPARHPAGGHGTLHPWPPGGRARSRRA